MKFAKSLFGVSMILLHLIGILALRIPTVRQLEDLVHYLDYQSELHLPPDRYWPLVVYPQHGFHDDVSHVFL